VGRKRYLQDRMAKVYSSRFQSQDFLPFTSRQGTAVAQEFNAPDDLADGSCLARWTWTSLITSLKGTN